jgi:hypothetical protein
MVPLPEKIQTRKKKNTNGADNEQNEVNSFKGRQHIN